MSAHTLFALLSLLNQQSYRPFLPSLIHSQARAKYVDKVTILEPDDKKILANLEGNCNIYQKLVLFLKLDTQAYYNMRMVLGLEIN